MKKISILITAVTMTGNCFAQQQSPVEEVDTFLFSPVKTIPITSVKDQNRSGTCWAFSSLGFFEAELLRLGKGEYNLCETFLEHKTYEDRALASVRMHGDISFSQGGSFYDAVYCMKNYGMMPEEAMPLPGSLYGDTLNNFNEFFPLLTAYIERITKGDFKKLTPAWFRGYNGILDAYLGQVPETFTYQGKQYTPKTYQESLGLKMDDYVSLTSYTHHPFYTQFIIEVQDNWRWGTSYNLPIDELMEVMDNAVRNGYTFAWGSDVSEDGFSRNGVAVYPDVAKFVDSKGSDMDHWVGKPAADRKKELTRGPQAEKEFTQEERQQAFDNWETEDDHGMLIYGLAVDQNGKEYFMVKNSWGNSGYYKGTWYASKAFVRNKTMNILIHKDAIPKKIAKKLGL